MKEKLAFISEICAEVTPVLIAIFALLFFWITVQWHDQMQAQLNRIEQYAKEAAHTSNANHQILTPVADDELPAPLPTHFAELPKGPKVKE